FNDRNHTGQPLRSCAHRKDVRTIRQIGRDRQRVTSGSEGAPGDLSSDGTTHRCKLDRHMRFVRNTECDLAASGQRIGIDRKRWRIGMSLWHTGLWLKKTVERLERRIF